MGSGVLSVSNRTLIYRTIIRIGCTDCTIVPILRTESYLCSHTSNMNKFEDVMENNLIASIFEANHRIQQCLNQPLILPLNEIDIAEKVAAENAIGGRQTQVMSLKEIEYEYEERYIVSIIGAKQQRNDNLVSKSVYIAYEISVTRISDGYTKSVLRRFRDIRALYHEVRI